MRKSVTAEEMRRIDERAIREYGIPSIVLMENAGVAWCDEILRSGRGRLRSAVVVAGKGRNGGDGFVVARHLSNHGVRVRVYLFAEPSQLSPDPKTNFRILGRMKVPCATFRQRGFWTRFCRDVSRADRVVDALFGTGLSRSVEGPSRVAIEEMNHRAKKIVSVDVPSGLDADTGRPCGAAVRADLTVTFGAMKRGLLARRARQYCGRVVVRDISLPKALL
jgi:NAD(P)H-hydrate epimerase